MKPSTKNLAFSGGKCRRNSQLILDVVAKDISDDMSSLNCRRNYLITNTRLLS